MERIKELIKKLNKYAYEYYVLDKPTIADKQYDALYDELVELEKQAGVILENSPTRRVGGDPISKFEKYTHKHRLYSLDKAQSLESIENWINKTEKNVGEREYSVEYKFDGLTMNLSYEKGKFVRATTRGNGIVGEDVTKQVLTIKTFPLTIDYKGDLEVVGEAIMYLSKLEEYNVTAEVSLKNARNAVAGAIRNLDPKETAKREPHIIFYSINYIEDDDIIHSQREVIEFLEKNRFKTSPYFKIVKGKDKIKQAINEIGEARKTLNFLIDGVVIKIDDYRSREILGVTEKFPKWAVAYKFEAEETTTILEDVIWQVGRTGKLTPLAILQPQELCGVTVSRATLNNYGDITRKQIKIGDRVFIRRSNDVIPEVLGMAETFEESKKIEKINKCPSCGSEVIERGANIFCPNELRCPTQIIARLTHFASRNAMNIEGFSEKTAKLFFKELDIVLPYQLFFINKEQLLELEGIKDKKADNLIKAIDARRKISFSRFIYALGILNVGIKTAKDLANEFDRIEELMNAKLDELILIDDIGEVIAKSIIEYFNDELYLNNLMKLLDIVEIDYKNSKKTIGGKLEGQVVVLTGTLVEFKRSKATEILESLGAKVTSTVTKKTTLVIYGENAGSKLEKAKNLGTKIMTELEFKELINK